MPKKSRKRKMSIELEQFILLENLEYSAKYHPDGFADIALIRTAAIQLLRRLIGKNPSGC